jgi:pimeloyl-ACP methyl ester carboxylesterase
MIAPRVAAAAAVFALGLAGCGQNDGPRRSIELSECRLPKLPVAAQCGTLEVPENRNKPGGRKISLAIAILPANTLNPRSDPLFILAGGPGQAASYLGPFAAALTGVRKDRDIVLVDQRGTGRSSPLQCAAFKADDSADATLELDQLPRAARCVKELAEAGADAAQYTTAAWIADLDAVRNALGYAKVNLWGGSYGTRVALEYLRAYPARVRSVVLDGVAAPSMKVTIDVWPSRELALTAVLRRLRAVRSVPQRASRSSGHARSHSGKPGSERSKRRRDGPPHRRGRDAACDVRSCARGAAPTHVRARALRAAARGDRCGGRGQLHAALRRSDALRRRPCAADEQRAPLLGTCTEDVPRITAADIQRALAGARSKSLATQALAVCDVWPKGEAAPDATKPVVSDVPVLILSGGLDPVTPPANGAEVAKTLSASRHIVARGYGHIVSPHACGPRLIAAFIDDPTFATLPASCVGHFEKSARPPLWPDRLGARS